MFLLVEGVNPLLELEKRRQVQRLMNNSWRKTIKCINAARLAQLEEHWSAEREVVASNPSRTNNQSLQKTAWWGDAGCKTLSQLRWSRRWEVKLSRWPWVEMLQLLFLLSNGALKRVKPFASMHTAIKYTIRSYRATDFDYCSAVWDGLTQQLTEKLQLNFN